MDNYISKELAIKKLQMQLLDLELNQNKGDYSELCENRGAREAIEEAIYSIRVIQSLTENELKFLYDIEKKAKENINKIKNESEYDNYEKKKM